MPFKSLRYIKGLLFRMIKNLGASPGQAAPALTFCIPASCYRSMDDKGAKWSRTINRKEGNYVVASAAANGLAYLPVKKGNAFELHRLQHFTSPATEPLGIPGGRRLCNGPRARTGGLNESLTPPRTRRLGLLNQKDPDQVRSEAQHEAPAFEATMAAAGREPTKQGKLRRMWWW
jgi:hypothetical protein